MHLFIQGERGIGKSTLLRQALLRYERRLQGFVEQRLLADGKRVGFRAVALAGSFPPAEAEYTGQEAGVFMLKGQRNMAVLEETIAKVERDSHCAEKAVPGAQPSLLVLDEIGGAELLSDAFTGTLWRLLESGIPCLGVWKSKENLAHTASVFGLPKTLMERHQEMERRLSQAACIITLDAGNREQVKQSIMDFILCHAGETE